MKINYTETLKNGSSGIVLKFCKIFKNVIRSTNSHIINSVIKKNAFTDGLKRSHTFYHCNMHDIFTAFKLLKFIIHVIFIEIVHSRY